MRSPFERFLPRVLKGGLKGALRLHRRLRRGHLNSLKARLLAAALVVALIILPAASVALVSLYREAATSLLDDSLGREADRLIVSPALQRHLARLPLSDKAGAGTVYTAPPGLAVTGGPGDNLLAAQRHWQVSRLQPGFRVTLTSASLEGRALKLPSRLAAAGRERATFTGFQRSPVPDLDGRHPLLRVFERQVVLELNGKTALYAFAVARDMAPIEDNIARFQVRLLGIFALLALALVLAMVWVVRFGLAPLARMGRALGAIRTGQAKRLSGRFPREITPLQRELNSLLASREAVVERARTHVGNLAHALKTPLSVMLNEARSAKGAFARKVEEQVVVMQQQVAHHLDRARMAALANVIGEVTEVCPVLKRLVRTLDKIYRDKALDFALHCPRDARFYGEQQDLEEMAGNLLDNGGKLARSKIVLKVQVSTGAQEGTMWLDIVVEDDGPGLSDSEKARVMNRGQRLDSQVPGSGLGLSIAGDLAALYRGRLELGDSPLGGLRAHLRLPAAREPSG